MSDSTVPLYFCCDERRRDAIRGSSLNGIDYLEVVDHEVLDAASELSAVRLVHRRFQHDTEPPFAEWLDRASDVGVDLEAARQQLGFDHLGEGLTPLAAR